MKYVILESGGKQYKATEGVTIEVDRLQAQPGDQVNLDRVLLFVEDDQVKVGQPTLSGLSVQAKVVEHFKGEKTFNFTYSPKKRIRQKTGHRQQYTRLQIEKIG